MDYQSYQFRLECFQLGQLSDIKSDSYEGVHHEVGAIIVSLKRRSKVLGVTESEKAHLAGVRVNCLND